MTKKFRKQLPYFLAGVMAMDPQLLDPKLVDLQTGRASKLSKELETKGIGIFVSRDCSPCRKYFEILKSCPEKLQKKLHFVSVDAAKKSKEMLEFIPAGRPLFLLKNEDDSIIIQATPTNMYLDDKGQLQKKIGILNCESLASWSGNKL